MLSHDPGTQPDNLDATLHEVTTDECPNCEGECGRFVKVRQEYPGGSRLVEEWFACERCGGSGEVDLT